MPNNNVAILSIMSKFDEKSAREAAKRADKVYEEALSDIGNVNFDKKLIENFDKAMNLLKNKFKKVNLSSYTNSLLDSIFSDKDIKEKSKDIESFISKIEMLKKASSGQDINAFNTFSAKQIDALISRTEKLAQKQEEINEKTREYNREATKIAKANRSISTIDKNYGNQDYSKTLESLKESLGTEKEFTTEQNQSIENLAKMINLYQIMEKSEPQKGTAEAIRYSKDLLTVTQKIKEERDKIDAFSKKGASTYITNNGLSSIDKVSDYTVSKSKEDFVKASLSNLKSQEAKLQSELTTYISESVQKNLAKVSKEVDAVVDKAEKRVENLQNKIDSLQSKPSNAESNNSVIGNIISDSDIKSLEEIEDKLYAISDLDAEGEATKQQLKEYIQLYKQYEQLIANDSTVKFDPGLKEEYDFIVESDSKLKKYADTLDETISKQKELNAVKSNENEVFVDTQTEQLVKQENQIKETIQAEKQLQDTQEKVSSNTKISVDVEQAIADINKIKESLNSIPEEKNIKITVSESDYTNTPLLSDAEGNTITAFRGVVGAWSGLINQDGIGFFTDKLKLAADYADSLAESGKVYQANLSFKNPLEVEGNGAKWDEIDFNGVKKTTDEIVELAKQLGHDGVIFKNIRDGFTDTNEDISNVMVALNAAQIKNEQVIGTVKAGTGEMIDVASKIDNATDTATNSTVESQNKIQEELKQTQEQAGQTAKSVQEVSNSPMKDVFQGEAEKSEIDAIASATEEAVQSKKDFATANEGVQSSIDGSKSPLQLEAELMEQIAKSAREAADAKKEFVEANKQVEKSADDSNSELKDTPKKDKYAKRNKISEDDFLNDSSKYTSIANSRLISSGNTILGNTVNADLVDGLVKVTAKIKDADGIWKTFSARIDADGNMFNQRFKAITKGVNQLEDDLKKFGKDKVKSDLTDIQIAKYQELENAIKNYEKISKRIASNSAYDGDEKSASDLLDTINEIMGKTNGGITVLSNEQLNKAQNKLDNIDQTISDIKQKTNISEFKNLEKLQSSAINKLNPYTNDTKYTIDFINKVNNLQKQIANFNLSNQSDVDRLKAIDAEIKNITKESNLLENKLVKQKSNLAEIVSQMKIFKSQNTNMSRSQKAELDQIINYAETMQRSGEEVASEVENIKVRFAGLKAEVNETGKAGKNFFDRIGNRLSDMNSKFIAQFLSWQDWIRYIQQGISTVRELDTALTEMRKVSDESLQSLKKYQSTTFDTADAVGTTAKQIQESTADYMRLGESLDEAAESAKTANILLNVSEFDNIEDATKSLVSMGQAYKDLDKLTIVDKLNEVGKIVAQTYSNVWCYKNIAW